MPNATYRNHGTHAEGIEILFDPAVISYRQLLEFFFQIHDPTHDEPPGQRHGHVVPLGDLLRVAMRRSRKPLRTIADVNASGLWPGKVVTEVAPAGDVLGSRARAPGLSGAVSERLHLPLPARELDAAGQDARLSLPDCCHGPAHCMLLYADLHNGYPTRNIDWLRFDNLADARACDAAATAGKANLKGDFDEPPPSRPVRPARRSTHVSCGRPSSCWALPYLPWAPAWSMSRHGRSMDTPRPRWSPCQQSKRTKPRRPTRAPIRSRSRLSRRVKPC